jgi:hypothetical protein
MPDRNDLIRDLNALGRSVPAPDARRMHEAVLARLKGTEPHRARPKRRRAITVAVAIAVVLGLLATPPVRAAVSDWFGFGAVIVREGESTATPAPTDTSLPTGRPLSLEDAAARVEFAVYELPVLGPPDRAWVTPDRRILTLDWDDRIRLDQSSSVSYTFRKTAPSFRHVTVDGRQALWFGDSHDVRMIDEDGTEIPETVRPAGQTLVWVDGDTTLRLEGDISLNRAVAAAETARPYD